MSDTVIEIDDLWKQYRLGVIGTGSLRHDLNRWCHRMLGKPDPYARVGESASDAREVKSKERATLKTGTRNEKMWALRGVSFEVLRGEILGIIGRNGAGKSTLLKILSRVTAPTRGEVRVRGRIASLLEVGTGFHPDLTGRENIYLNGAILGMTKAEITRKFDEIVDFSGIEQFVDTPVKRYSSGMYVRLAFAVAAHLEPEILIVDEVLAVGDLQFQKKCLGKMQDVATGGRTVLFVSHNMNSILSLCSSAIFLENGKVTSAGRAEAIVRHYLTSALPQVINGTPLSLRTDRTGNGNVRITSIRIEDENRRQIIDAVSGMDLSFLLAFQTKDGRDYSQVDPGISLHTETGETLFVFYASYAGTLLDAKGPQGELRCTLERLPLSPGRYIIGARITVNGEEADWPRDGIAFLNVEAGDFYGTGSKGADGATSFLVSGSWTSSLSQ